MEGITDQPETERQVQGGQATVERDAPAERTAGLPLSVMVIGALGYGLSIWSDAHHRHRH